MTQQLSPFLEGKFGWNYGENGWNIGMDENLLKFSFMFDRNVDGIVSTLPSPVNGQAWFLTTDKRLYFAVGAVFYSSPTPKWFQFQIKSTGQTYIFDGVVASQVDTSSEVNTRLEAVELTVSDLGTAAFEDSSFFATTTALDVVEADSQNYTDTLRTDLLSTTGSTRVGTANGQTVEQRLSLVRETILNYGTPTGIDDTALAQAMLTATNTLIVPSGVTLAIKNLELQNNSFVHCQGVLKLRSGCVDFDKILYAAGKTNVYIYVAELDGNAAGQSGNIGTHLIYMTNCVRPTVLVDYAHDHYYPTSSTIVNTDGIRDTSSGAIFTFNPTGGSTKVGYLKNWGREGVQCRTGIGHTFFEITCQGADGGPEYSGVQMSGIYHKMFNITVDNAGASGIGFDTVYGIADGLISTNTRENHGINIGHPGLPSTGSQLNNLVVDGAYRFGIAIAASGQDVGISNYTIRNCGEYGISVSDGVLRTRLDQGLVEYSGDFNLSTSAAVINIRNTRFITVDPAVLVVTPVTGLFSVGETVTAGAITGVVRRVVKNRAATGQILFLASVSGTFVAASTVTGSTSGASGTISVVKIPATTREITSGYFVQEAAYTTGGLGDVTKFSDGTMIFRNTVAVSATAATQISVATNFPSTSTWVGTPRVSATIGSVGSTNTYTVTRLSCDRTATNYTVWLNASVTQTYNIDVVAIGRWF